MAAAMNKRKVLNSEGKVKVKPQI